MQVQPPTSAAPLDLRATGFQVAPAYAGLYPALPVYSGVVYYDPSYYDAYGPYYGTVRFKERLPTAEMLARALPEGVLDPGGIVIGFLYFEHVDSDSTGVELEAHLVNAENLDTVGSLSIPFKVGG